MFVLRIIDYYIVYFEIVNLMNDKNLSMGVVMDVSEAIKNRRSIRKFKPDPIPEEKIRLLLEGARLSPSGTNTQP